MGVLKGLVFWLELLAACEEPQARDQLFFSADKKIWQKQERKLFLEGNAVIQQDGRHLKANSIQCDLETHLVEAKGEVVFQDEDGVWRSDAMSLALKDGTGFSEHARLESNQFLILGATIERLDDKGSFEVLHGTYTTCTDCQFTWSISAKRIRLRKEDYAWFTDALVHLKGIPVFWLPVFAVPLKSQRQSGFLQPVVTFSAIHGFGLQQPLFIDHGPSADQTLSAGWLWKRGFRGTWEGRAKWSETGEAKGRFIFTNDPVQIPWKLFEVKFQERGLLSGLFDVTWISQDALPFLFPEDLLHRTYPYLEQRMGFWGGNEVVYAHVEFFAPRRLLSDPETPQGRLWDTGTVQAMPLVQFGITEYLFADGAVSFQLDGQWANFRQSAASSFLVQAERVFLKPQWSLRQSFWGLEWVPRFGLEWLSYRFYEGNPNLSRGAFFLEQQLSMDFSKTFSSNGTKWKHTLVPMVEHRWLPLVVEDEAHPFVEQVKKSAVFDERDILLRDAYQLGAVYFPPRGQAIDFKLSQGLLYFEESKNWVRVPSKSLRLQVGQTVNLRRKPWQSRSWVESVLAAGPWEGRLGLTYLPDRPQGSESHRTQIHTQLSLVLDAVPKQGIFDFNRSFSIRYTRIPEYLIHNLGLSLKYSLNDYVLPEAFLTYSIEQNSFLAIGGRFLLQAPARCWRFVWSGSYVPFIGWNMQLQFELNWFGDSFSLLPVASK